jgi:nicotinate-nucleotide adenylyltransferase
MRIAFFGGSFDPPHLGHIAVARAAQQSLSLDRVLFAPVGLQPLKPAGPTASFQDRVAMTRLAIAAEPSFELSLADAPNPAPNYTFDTLAQFRLTLSADSQLYLLIGADSFRTLHHWHHAAELPFLAQLIVASRPNENIGNLNRLLPKGIDLQPIPNQPDQFTLTNSSGQRSQLTILPNLHYEISATQLRNHLQNPTANHSQLLNPAVEQYIRHHHLYQPT